MKKESQLRLVALGALLVPLLWIAALIGTSYPRFHALLVSVNGLTLADYGAEALNLSMAPLTSQVYRDAYRDALAAPASGKYTFYTPSHGNLQANASPLPSARLVTPSPTASTTPSGVPTPSASASPSASPSPNATPTPSSSPTSAPTPTPTPVPTATPTPSTGPYVVQAGTTYSGDLVINNQSVIVNGTVTGDVRVTSGDVTINQGGVVGQDVVVTSGSIVVKGTVNHDVKAYSTNVLLDNSAWVGNDVQITSGTLTRRPGSHVGGSITIN